MEGNYIWCWNKSDDPDKYIEWQPYSLNISDEIERSFNFKIESFEVEINNTIYIIDLKKNLQINSTDRNRIRNISRELKSDFPNNNQLGNKCFKCKKILKSIIFSPCNHETCKNCHDKRNIYCPVCSDRFTSVNPLFNNYN